MRGLASNTVWPPPDPAKAYGVTGQNLNIPRRKALRMHRKMRTSLEHYREGEPRPPRQCMIARHLGRSVSSGSPESAASGAKSLLSNRNQYSLGDAEARH